MGSDSKRPKPRLRISFLHKDDRRESGYATHDEILDSLTRQPHPQEVPPEQVTGRSVESVESARFEGHTASPNTPTRSRERHAGTIAVSLFFAGFVVIWVYGYLTGAYDIPYLSALTRTPEFQVGFQSVSSNLLLASLIVAAVIVAVLFKRHKRKS